jgi:hypothetical protein
MSQTKNQLKRKTSIQIMISLLTTRNTQQFRFDIFLKKTVYKLGDYCMISFLLENDSGKLSRKLYWYIKHEMNVVLKIKLDVLDKNVR